MKKKYIIIVIFITFIIVLSWPISPSKEEKIKNQLINSYKNIEKLLSNSEDVNYIKNGKIITGDKTVQSKNIIGNGKFVKISKDISYGYINYDGYCLQKKANGNIKIEKETCKTIERPELAYKLVEKNSLSIELKKDELSNKDYPFNSKKYFVGENPNNYIIYSNSCWRIVNISNNNDLKIVYEGKANNNTCQQANTNISGSIGLFTWDIDKSKIGNWDSQSYLKDRMDYWAKAGIIDVTQLKIELDVQYLDDAYWNIGQIKIDNKTLAEDIQDEQQTISNISHKLGLLNSSDYLKISCQTSSSLSTKSCSENNYLYKNKYNWWTINNVDNNQKNVWIIMQDGTVANTPIKLSNEYFFSGVRVAAYLNDDIYLIGNGTEKEPYVITK